MYSQANKAGRRAVDGGEGTRSAGGGSAEDGPRLRLVGSAPTPVPPPFRFDVAPSPHRIEVSLTILTWDQWAALRPDEQLEYRWYADAGLCVRFVGNPVLG